MSRGLEVVVGEEAVGRRRRGAPSTTSATLGGEHDPEAAAADVPAHHPLGVRVEAAAGGDDARSGARPERLRPGASPTITTAAAPSPNSPLATRFAIEASSRCTVSEHSSTDEQHGDVVGIARSR